MFTTWKHFSQWAAIAVATILLSAWEAQAQKPPKLSFTTYHLHPGSPYVSSEARGLNDSGTAVGYAEDESGWTRAMCWRLSNGSVHSQALSEGPDENGALPGTTSAIAVNSGGAIAGMGKYVVEVPDLDGGSSYCPLYQGMYWSSEDAEPIRLEPPDGHHACTPLGMNDDGVIVGLAYETVLTPEGCRYVEVTGVAWRVVDDEVSDVTMLGPFDIDDDASVARGVNNAVDNVCLIAGQSLWVSRIDGFVNKWISPATVGRLMSKSGTAVTWAVTLMDDGTLGVSDPEEIVTPGDGRYSNAYGINDLGEACGVATKSDGGYLGYAGAQLLGTLRDTYFGEFSVQDVNSAGEAVGTLEVLFRWPKVGYHCDAVIWVGGSPTKLESIMGNSTFSDLHIAYKINTRGDIVGGGGIKSKSGGQAFLMIRK